MEAILHFFSSAWANFGPVFILLGLLIFVHELGHFWVARLCGVRVETFSMGFGKKIFKYKPGDTTYCLSIIPLGGYVKMYGDDPTADVPMDQREHAFLHKSIARRTAIVAAGPLMNLVFAIFLFMVIGRVGEELPTPRVGDVPEHSIAAASGFQSGDKILQIDGKPIQSWNDVQSAVEHSAGQTLAFDVEHLNGDKAQVKAPVRLGPNDNILSFSKEVGQIDGLSNDSLSSVVGVNPDLPAGKSGLKSLDLVTEVNSKAVGSFMELQAAIQTTTGDLHFKVRKVDAEDKPDNERTVTVPRPEGSKLSTLAALGIDSAEMYVLKVAKDSPAFKAGINAGDRVTAIDGHAVKNWDQVLSRVKSFQPDQPPLQFTLSHDPGSSVEGGPTVAAARTLAIRPEMTSLMNPKGQEESRYTVGIVSGSFKVGSELTTIQIKNPVRLVQYGLTRSMDWTGMMIMSFVRLGQGEVSAKNIGGIITIGRVASRSFEIGLSSFLKTMSILSINLFLLNLLPVPVLDGGHLMFFALEALKGSPVSLKKLAIAQQVGLTLLIMLMVVAFYNDISNLFRSPW